MRTWFPIDRFYRRHASTSGVLYEFEKMSRIYFLDWIYRYPLTENGVQQVKKTAGELTGEGRELTGIAYLKSLLTQIFRYHRPKESLHRPCIPPPACSTDV